MPVVKSHDSLMHTRSSCVSPHLVFAASFASRSCLRKYLARIPLCSFRFWLSKYPAGTHCATYFCRANMRLRSKVRAGAPYRESAQTLKDNAVNNVTNTGAHTVQYHELMQHESTRFGVLAKGFHCLHQNAQKKHKNCDRAAKGHTSRTSPIQSCVQALWCISRLHDCYQPVIRKAHLY